MMRQLRVGAVFQSVKIAGHDGYHPFRKSDEKIVRGERA